MGFLFGQKSDFQNITKGVKGDFSTFDVDRPRNALKGICGGRFGFSVICCYIVMSGEKRKCPLKTYHARVNRIDVTKADSNCQPLNGCKPAVASFYLQQNVRSVSRSELITNH